ncbi:MAG: ABC transporter permease [Clostridia bacterium]|nr:ABC transporter permease [Clostridia bacterium]
MKKTSLLRSEQNRERLLGFVCGVLSICIFLAFWEWGARYTHLSRFLSGPSEVIPAFVKSFTEPIGVKTMGTHIITSVTRVMTGFVIASAVGIVIGIAMGTSRIMRALFKPLIELIRPIPGIAWIPISILWFGTGEVSKVFIIAVSTFSLVAINAMAGATAVDPGLIGAAKMLGASNAQVFFTVILPASVPQIFAGLQTALSICWMIVLAAEMVRSEFGVGWIITAGSNAGNMTQVMVGIIAIGIIGLILANLLRWIEARLCAWKESK